MQHVDDPNQPARRSQRERKISKRLLSQDNNKRKRNDSDTEDDPQDITDIDGVQPDYVDDNDDQVDFDSARAKPTAKGPRGRPKGAPAAKKPRTTKVPVPKAPKTTMRKPRKPKADQDAFDPAKIAKDSKITADNPLFNTILNPSAALQSTAEDFLESLVQTPGPAQAELINCFLRACGCNDSVDGDEVVDYDGVLDSLDNFTESHKQDNSPVYPLTSKLPAFKKFRKSLSEFIERVIVSSAELGSLYNTDLMATIQTWIIAMSSSHVRSFRHTATVLALEVETALCDVAAAVDKEAEVIGRQREGERKRKAGGKGAGAREKELAAKAEKVREQRLTLSDFLKEFVDGVFVHRYRDLDPNIRAECVRALGLWFKKYPGHFLDGSYLRYVGWVLSDTNTQVRLEAVKALSGVYQQVDYIGTLNHFTERFKPRLIEMATGDTELSVRVAVIQVLEAIYNHSLLEDEEREKLCLLVFDEEAKVRKAVSGFVKGVWTEGVEERLVGKKGGDVMTARVGVKVLAMLMVKWAKSLDKANREGEEEEEEMEGSDDSMQDDRAKDVAALVNLGQKGRTALAVEALWDEVEPISDWEGLLEVLLLDHSATKENISASPRKRRANGKAHADDAAVDEAWRLEEVEETILLEVLVAALRWAKVDASSTKKKEDETVTSDITRALIEGLPRLFAKYQTDQNRIAVVLMIPPLMNLDLYLEMRMITAYANLWDDVTKQFLSHSSMVVITHAAAVINQFMEATSLSNTNSTKILELEDELSSGLRDAVAGRDEIEVASFTEDEVLALSSLCSRLSVLAGTRDMTTWMDEDEGGKQSSAWDIISALVERGRLGYKEEEQMVEQALNVLGLQIIWKARGLTSEAEVSSEETLFRDKLKEQRESLLEKLTEYAVGTQSNTVEGVKRAAFQTLMALQILFCPERAVDGPIPSSSLALILDDEVQYRCAGYIQAEIERYVEDVDGGKRDVADSDDGRSSEDDEQTDNEPEKGEKGKKKAGQGKKTNQGLDVSDPHTSSRARLEQEYVFMGVMSTFLRAIRAGAIHVRHGAILLAHYGRLGPTFDLCSRVIVDSLREEGMLKNNGEVVSTVVTQALRESFTLYTDGIVRNESHTIALSKLLSSCFVVRGAQLSIQRRLDSRFIVEIHTSLLTWIIKRIATCESNKNKRGCRRALRFFKPLQSLLAVIDSRDALKIKAHMDQAFAQSKVEVDATSKAWDSQRSYEKRLSTAMLKDKGRKGPPKGGKSADEASGDEAANEVEKMTGETQTTAPPARPKPRPVRRRSAQSGGSHPPSENEDLDLENGNPMQAASTSNPRPRPKAVYRKKSPSKSPNKPPPMRSQDIATPDIEANGTLKSPRKRGYSDVETEGEREQRMDEEPANTSPERPDSPGEIQIQRKRVRH